MANNVRARRIEDAAGRKEKKPNQCASSRIFVGRGKGNYAMESDHVRVTDYVQRVGRRSKKKQGTLPTRGKSQQTPTFATEGNPSSCTTRLLGCLLCLGTAKRCTKRAEILQPPSIEVVLLWSVMPACCRTRQAHLARRDSSRVVEQPRPFRHCSSCHSLLWTPIKKINNIWSETKQFCGSRILEAETGTSRIFLITQQCANAW